MRVCFFTLDDLSRSASAMRSREIGGRLLDAGIEVSYLVEDYTGNQGDCKLDRRAEVVRVPVGISPTAIAKRRRAIHLLKPDIVHVLNPSVKALLSLAGLGSIRVIGDWEEWRAKISDNNFGLIRQWSESIVDEWLFKRSEEVIVTSKYLQDAFAKRGRLSHYIPYADYLGDLDVQCETGLEKAIVYLGSFQKRFDHDILFKSLVLLKQQGEQPRCVFVGDGPTKQYWERFATSEQLENVVFAGRLDWTDAWPLLRSAHVLAFPIRDNLVNRARCPAKVYAYARSGRPILTCRVGEVPEVLGASACYTSCDEHEYSRELRRMWRAKRQDDIDYGLSRHTWDHRAESFLSVLETIGKRS